MSNLYTNTGIVDECWNSRGIITHNFITKNMVMTDRNVLYAIFRENGWDKDIKIKMSDDNGFTWKTVKSLSDPGGTLRLLTSEGNSSGPIMHLALTKTENGREESLIMYVGNKYVSDPLTNETDYRISYVEYTIKEDNTLESATIGTLLTGQDFAVFDISTNNNSIYVTYASYNRLYTRKYFHDAPNINVGSGIFFDGTDNWFNLFSTYLNQDETIDILGVRNYGNQQLTYVRFDYQSYNFTNPVKIRETSEIDIEDISIGRDGYGNLLVLWHEVPFDNTYSKIFWSMSKDNGVTWSTPSEIIGASNNSDFIDAPLNKPTSRTTLLSGIQGFLIGYVRNRENIGTAYVRTLISYDGNTYILSDQRVAASHPTKDVTGIRFFQPASNAKINMDNVANVRFAYQLGQGNDANGLDTIPVYFGQKLLSDEAYTDSLYLLREIDTPLQNQLLCSFNLIGSTSENIDYYNQGLIGNITNKYISAFERFGTSIELVRYEPLGQSYLDNKLAYSKFETIFARVFFDDLNYSLPQPSGNDNFVEYIERDTRQIHIPPNIHIGRNFIINLGNKLKRTVWLLKFAGNEYEVTQLVPKFVDNQIAYYTANAYVVGPSRDPFSRVILPSET